MNWSLSKICMGIGHGNDKTLIGLHMLSSTTKFEKRTAAEFHRNIFAFGNRKSPLNCSVCLAIIVLSLLYCEKLSYT